MNDVQLYQLYCSIPKRTVNNQSRIYPNYVVITGRALRRYLMDNIKLENCHITHNSNYFFLFWYIR